MHIATSRLLPDPDFGHSALAPGTSGHAAGPGTGGDCQKDDRTRTGCQEDRSTRDGRQEGCRTGPGDRGGGAGRCRPDADLCRARVQPAMVRQPRRGAPALRHAGPSRPRAAPYRRRCRGRQAHPRLRAGRDTGRGRAGAHPGGHGLHGAPCRRPLAVDGRRHQCAGSARSRQTRLGPRARPCRTARGRGPGRLVHGPHAAAALGPAPAADAHPPRARAGLPTSCAPSRSRRWQACAAVWSSRSISTAATSPATRWTGVSRRRSAVSRPGTG